MSTLRKKALFILIFSSIAYANYGEVLKLFKQNKISSQEAVQKIKAQGFPYNVTDLKIVDNKVKWIIGDINSTSQSDNEKKNNNSSADQNIAMDKKEVVKEKIYIMQTKKVHSFSISSAIGSLAIDQDNNSTLEMYYLKLAGTYKFKLNENYDLKFGAGFTYFTNVRFSNSDDVLYPTSFYYDLKTSIVRKFSRSSVSLIYDIQNYFLPSSSSGITSFSPEKIQKLTISPSYAFTNKVIGYLTTGYITGLTTQGVSGLDYSIGGVYIFNKKFSSGINLYQNQVTRDDLKDNASAYTLSLNYSL
jgi:hypothetical protein